MTFAFLSHRSSDKPRILPFVQRLSDNALPFWIDNPNALNAPDVAARATGIQRGKDWPTEIDKALAEATVLVVFWSSSWKGGGAFLSMEHAIALHRHRAGSARYFPVLLDSLRDLPDDVRDLREQRHDLVQAIDISRDGEQGWNTLFLEVKNALATAPSTQVAVLPTNSHVDWRQVLRGPPRDEAQRASLLLSLPEGPPLDGYSIPTAAIRAIAESTSSMTAAGIVGDANALMMEALPIPHEERYAFIVMRGSVPDPNLVPMQSYWNAVVLQACYLGPRMVASLLMALPKTGQSGPLSGFEDKIGAVLNQVGGLK
jgi:hypothetical protein